MQCIQPCVPFIVKQTLCCIVYSDLMINLCCQCWPSVGPPEGTQECSWGSEAFRQGSWCATQPHQAICALQGKEVREGSWQEEQPWIQGLSCWLLPVLCCHQHCATFLFGQSTVISNHFLLRVVAQFVVLVWILKNIWRICVALSTGWAWRQCSIAPLIRAWDFSSIPSMVMLCVWCAVIVNVGQFCLLNISRVLWACHLRFFTVLSLFCSSLSIWPHSSCRCFLVCWTTCLDFGKVVFGFLSLSLPKRSWRRGEKRS